MYRFIGRHLIKFITLMIAVSIVVFFLVSVSPIDPVQANVGQAAYINMSEEKRAALASYWGTETPFWERYAVWMSSLVQGDMGTSLRLNAPVSEVIASRTLNSLALIGFAWLISGVLGFVLGVCAGMWQGRAFDKVIKLYCYVLSSTPTFWFALVLLIIFSALLGWFPFGFSAPVGLGASEISIFDLLHHMVLPVMTLSVIGVANIALHTREKTIDVMESDYIRFVLTRGEGRWSALFHHGLRNVAFPAVTLQFASFSEVFGGSVLAEQVFSYPGLGQAAVTAGLGGDVALLAGIALVSASLVFGGNLIANFLYVVIDPRMRRGGDSC